MTVPATRQNNTAVASAMDYMAALAAEAETYKGGGGGVSYLKFSGNDGYYSYGAEDNALDEGTRAAVNTMSLKRGWICWNNGQMIEEVMRSILEGAAPQKHELTDHGPYVAKGDGWSEQKTIEMKTIDGPAVDLLFQANNRSKLNALEALMKQIGREFRNYPGCVPIIALGSSTFEAQERNADGEKVGRKMTKYAPVLEIVDWMPEEELLALQEGSPADYPPEDQALLEGPAEEQYEEVQEEAPEEPAPAPAAGGRRTAPVTGVSGRPANTAAPAPAPAARPAARPAPAAAAAPAPAARPAARPAPATPAAPAAAAPRGRRF